MKVSVLIPAYRATYLSVAIASVLTQGYDAYELLIHDDSHGDEVLRVVKRFGDRRIVYSRTAGGEGSAENIRQLWNRASSPLVKYLFDDDLLLPHALALLMDQAKRQPDASYLFGHRDIVDATGRIISQPRFVAEGTVVALSRSDISAQLISRCHNRVGELSNVLINRTVGLSLDDLFSYQGHAVDMLVDVALFLNAAEKGRGVGIGATIGHYRRHGEQNSAFGFNPDFYKSLFEWDIFLRGEYASGYLSPEQALAGVDRLASGYANWSARLPELEILREGLGELRLKIEAGQPDVFDDAFRTRWARAATAARARAASEPARIRSGGTR